MCVEEFDQRPLQLGRGGQIEISCDRDHAGALIDCPVADLEFARGQLRLAEGGEVTMHREVCFDRSGG
jgi:hypothetical protein